MRSFYTQLLTLLLCTLFFHNISFAASPPKLFFFFGPENPLELKSYQQLLTNPCVSGVQIVYTWKELEPKKGIYDFSRIEKDLRYLDSIHKKLFVQLQDRSFQPDLFYVPDYIRSEKKYHGGVAMQYDFPGEGKPITEGWVARVWDPSVRERFQLLLKKLADKVDGKIYGLNLPETAVDFDSKKPPLNFTPENYFNAEMENLAAARKTFHHSNIIQYVNFFPGEWNNDHHYMSRLFAYASKHQIGLGGPDVVPYRNSQMKNSYPFFHQYRGKINPVGMAIQEPDYTYKKPGTHLHYQFSDFYSFTREYLGATILFWNVQEPFLSEQLLPAIKNKGFFSCAKEN